MNSTRKLKSPTPLDKFAWTQNRKNLTDLQRHPRTEKKLNVTMCTQYKRAANFWILTTVCGLVLNAG